MRIKPANYRGTRDFLPHEMRRRRYILNTIRSIFHLYGFQEIETPAIEKLETLTGKYGDEGDKLLFKILNSGDFLAKTEEGSLLKRDSRKLTSQISEKGLRYDLTVPLARFVVQHQNELVFPFKRYHIGSVWRADRPQKGRYREFYQCDADVIGSKSMLNEIELTQIFAEAFERMDLNCSIRINNRKVLEALIDFIDEGERIQEILTVLDKLDKMGLEKLNIELSEKIGEDKTRVLLDLINQADLDQLQKEVSNEKMNSGVSEIKRVFSKCKGFNNLVFDPTLTRGLDYYTGIIWEVNANEGSIKSSIASGGRYDNLTEMFGGRDLSGVGISFGIERIYDILQELKKFPESIDAQTTACVAAFDRKSFDYGFDILSALRDAGICAEIYPEPIKMQKQMKYINQKNIPFAILIGGDEVDTNTVILKNMNTGDQQSLEENQLIKNLLQFRATGTVH